MSPLRGGGDFQDRVKEKRVGDGSGCSPFVRASSCAVDGLTGALELAQVPFRQREEGRRTTSASGPSASWQGCSRSTPAQGLSRGSEVALEEQNQPERATSHATLYGSPFGLGFFQEGLGSVSRADRISPRVKLLMHCAK